LLVLTVIIGWLLKKGIYQEVRKREKLKHEVDNLRLPDLQCFKISKKRSCSAVRTTEQSVVTTTYPMINDSTINKSQVRILCGKFTRELDKEPLLN